MRFARLPLLQQVLQELRLWLPWLPTGCHSIEQSSFEGNETTELLYNFGVLL